MGLKAITIDTLASEPAHIVAADDAAIYQSVIGNDKVMDIGNKCAATVISNNKVRVSDGLIFVGGRAGRIESGDYEDMTIENGESGKNRNDLICVKVTVNGTSDTMEMVVVKGTAGTTASDPTVTQGNLYEGDAQRYFPLYRVKIEGLSIVSVEQLFEVGMNYDELKKAYDELNSNYLGFPDYTKVLATYSNSDFIAPENCWAKIESTSGWTNTTLNINGNGIIIQQIKNSDSYPIKTSTLVPLKKGDQVTMSSKTSINGIEVVLYPML